RCTDPPGGDSAKGEEPLLVAGEEPRLEGVAPFDLAEERLAVLGVADGTRRKCERAVGAGFLRRAPVLGKDVANARDGLWEQDVSLVHALAQAGDLEAPVELPHR